MGPIDYIVIGIGVCILCGVIAFLIYQKIKGKNVGCGCGCNGCPSAGACGGVCPSKKETSSEDEKEETDEKTV